MGEVLSRVAERNLCLNSGDNVPIPKYHFKCRYDKNDNLSPNQIYTRMKDIFRYPVPREYIKWSVEYLSYNPIEFTSTKILTKDGKNWTDPHINDPEYKDIKFNQLDRKYNCDRQSHHKAYEFALYKEDQPFLVPCNPVGRTGLIGRGHLGRWGPNHAADPIVTRWKRDESGKIISDPKSGKKVLEFVSIRRKDTKEWAIPGGMRDPGERINKTLIREFSEEALNNDISFDKFGRLVSGTKNLEERLDKFFKGGIKIYQGYVDDPRNTDNAWMETIACNFHDETGDLVGCFKLSAGDDAEHVSWLELNSNLKLFASHKDFLHEVANLHNANW